MFEPTEQPPTVGDHASNVCPDCDVLGFQEIAQQFDRFPKLPQELEDAIWDMSRPAGRIITISNTMVSPDPTEYIVTSNANLFPIGLLKACRDSRSAALRWYQPILQGPLPNPIFFDVERDTLRFVDVFSLSACSELRKHRFLKYQGANLDFRAVIRHLEVARPVITELLGVWTALETLILEEPCGSRFIDPQILRSLRTSKEEDLKKRWRRLGMDTAKVPTIKWAVELKHKLQYSRSRRYFSDSCGSLRDSS